MVAWRILYDRNRHSGGRRYQCNDFELDDDFNDLVFTVITKTTA